MERCSRFLLPLASATVPPGNLYHDHDHHRLYYYYEVVKLADFATSQAEACYAAFTFGLRHRWTYFLITLPDIAELLEPPERAIN